MGVQQDNALCHKSKKVLQWFEANEIDLIDWPAQSLDLNPIENLGELSKPKFEKKNPKLWKISTKKIVETGNKIPNGLCLKLIHSMPNRLGKVLKNKGLSE